MYVNYAQLLYNILTSLKQNCMRTGYLHYNNEDDHHEEAEHAAEARRGLVFSCGNVCRFGLVYVRALIYSKKSYER